MQDARESVRSQDVFQGSRTQIGRTKLITIAAESFAVVNLQCLITIEMNKVVENRKTLVTWGGTSTTFTNSSCVRKGLMQSKF